MLVGDDFLKNRGGGHGDVGDTIWLRNFLLLWPLPLRTKCNTSTIVLFLAFVNIIMCFLPLVIDINLYIISSLYRECVGKLRYIYKSKSCEWSLLSFPSLLIVTASYFILHMHIAKLIGPRSTLNRLLN